MNAFSETDCARARESVSAELDGELPGLGLQWHHAHLLACPECSVWAARVQEATVQLRATRLEHPGLGWTTPRRARRWAVSPAIAVASAAAVAASVVFGLGPRHVALDGSAQRPQPTNVSAARNVPSLLLDGSRLGFDSSTAGGPTTTPGHQSGFRAV
jgi:hypothetical protein